jgi:MFS family permease
MIPFRKRGIYQAMQNAVAGFGAICGASFGGSIADYIGWRWCFYLQVPVSGIALVLGALVLKDPQGGFDTGSSFSRTVLGKVDITGALLLVMGISVQLVGLSLGGNELPWSSPWVIGCLVGSLALLTLFAVVETRYAAIPIIPPRMFSGTLPTFVQTANNFVGLAAYAVSDKYSSITINAETHIYHSTCSCCHYTSKGSCLTPLRQQGYVSSSHLWQHL